MLSRKILNELHEIIKQRGELTKEQKEYAWIEEQAMNEMYPVTKPHEEIRHSEFRTLKSYIGEHAVNNMMEERGMLDLVGHTE